jgi:hypothetical protein
MNDEMINRYLSLKLREPYGYDKAPAIIDAAIAEALADNQQLRAALSRIKRVAMGDDPGADTDNATLGMISLIAEAALAEGMKSE